MADLHSVNLLCGYLPKLPFSSHNPEHIQKLNASDIQAGSTEVKD